MSVVLSDILLIEGIEVAFWVIGFKVQMTDFILFETSAGRNSEPQNRRITNRRISKGGFALLS
ncbi:MAG: hypothetical protein JSW26_14590, partial [Desulfobacterales bacterium]